MTLLDRSIRNPLRWWPIAFTAGYLAGHDWGKMQGYREGRLAAWREANEMIAEHRTRYDPKPVSAREERRRRRARNVA